MPVEESVLVPAPSHIIGPTWRRRTSGGWYLPERTLGWAILNWLYKYVRQPSGPRAGEPFLPTDEQARWILWWYAVDERGRFRYRKAVLRRLKGWGKDPIAACLALVELCGPVEFSHFDVNGEPVGKTRSSAWVQIAAVSLDQTKNTMSLFPAMISRELREDFGLDVNKTIIYSRAGGQIEAVTASPFALEGKRPTFVLKNETQWWVEANNGHAMAGVIAGNVDKSAYGGCRVLSICNAHVPGLESDAERDWDAYEKVVAGQAIDTGLLYDSIEAPADTPVSEIPSPDVDPEGFAAGIALLRAGLEIARGDAVWLDIETLIASILDIRNPITESRRKFLNQILASEDSWIAPYEWDSCHDTRNHPHKPGTTVYGSDFRLDLAGWWRVVLNGSFFAQDAQFNRLRAWWLSPSNNQAARYGASMYGPNGVFTAHSVSIFRPFNKGDSVSAYTYQDTGADLLTNIEQAPVNIAFEWVRDL